LREAQPDAFETIWRTEATSLPTAGIGVIRSKMLIGP